MTPEQTGEAYDHIADWWQQYHQESSYGLSALSRAMTLAPAKGAALDVGCGSSGRFMRAMQANGYAPEGLDVSARMITLARMLFPDCPYSLADVSEWQASQQYSLISAWDSTFHLPLEKQEPALANMCEALTPEGVLLFTCGDGDKPGNTTGSFQGQQFSYSTLGIPLYLSLLDKYHCIPRHLEYDQGFKGQHVCIIAQKRA